MTKTLSYSEILQQKKATEEAIAKLLKDLQEQIDCTIIGIATVNPIGTKTKDITVSILLNL